MISVCNQRARKNDGVIPRWGTRFGNGSSLISVFLSDGSFSLCNKMQDHVLRQTGEDGKVGGARREEEV